MSWITPAHFDSCDWQYEYPGRRPAFWAYFCHSACHWTWSLHLLVATQAYPKRPWRIVTSQAHSTVWDGEDTLWDGNFLALGIAADEAWELAAQQPDTEHLPIGELMLHADPAEIEALAGNLLASYPGLY